MSEQPTIKLPVEDSPTPNVDAFPKKALGKQPVDDDAAKATASLRSEDGERRTAAGTGWTVDVVDGVDAAG